MKHRELAFLARRRMSRTWCSSFCIGALRGKLSDIRICGGKDLRKVVLLIEKTFGIHGLFILVSFIHTLSPPPRPILPRY